MGCFRRSGGFQVHCVVNGEDASAHFLGCYFRKGSLASIFGSNNDSKVFRSLRLRLGALSGLGAHGLLGIFLSLDESLLR